MTFYLTAESLALAAASAGLRLDLSRARTLAKPLREVRDAGPGEPLLVIEDVADLPDPFAGVGVLAVGQDAGDAFALSARQLGAMQRLAAGGPLILRTGRILVGRSARQYLLCAVETPRTRRLCELIASYDPKHRPHLLAVPVDLAMPWHGANLYPNEPSAGYYMRWLGPDPVMRLAIDAPLAKLAAAGAPLVRGEITVALVYAGEALAALSVMLGGQRLPHFVSGASGLTRITFFLPHEMIADALRSERSAELILAMPLALKEMPQGTTDAGRTLTIALSGIELTAFYSERHVPRLETVARAAQVDRVDATLAALSARQKSPDGMLPCLFCDVDRGAYGSRANALNACAGNVLFHRLQLERVAEDAFALTVERPRRRVTHEGIAYLATAEPERRTVAIVDGRLAVEGASDEALRTAVDALAARLEPR